MTSTRPGVVSAIEARRLLRLRRHVFLEDAPYPMAVGVQDGGYVLYVNLRLYATPDIDIICPG